MKKLNELHKERSSPSESADKIKEKLWKDFLSKKSCIKNRKKFVEEQVKSRDAAVTEGAKFISEKRAYTILNECIKNGEIILPK